MKPKLYGDTEEAHTKRAMIAIRNSILKLDILFEDALDRYATDHMLASIGLKRSHLMSDVPVSDKPINETLDRIRKVDQLYREKEISFEDSLTQCGFNEFSNALTKMPSPYPPLVRNARLYKSKDNTVGS